MAGSCHRDRVVGGAGVVWCGVVWVARDITFSTFSNPSLSYPLHTPTSLPPHPHLTPTSPSQLLKNYFDWLLRNNLTDSLEGQVWLPQDPALLLQPATALQPEGPVALIPRNGDSKEGFFGEAEALFRKDTDYINAGVMLWRRSPATFKVGTGGERLPWGRNSRCGMASGGGGSAGVGGVPCAASTGSPAAAGRGDARVRRAPAGLPTVSECYVSLVCSAQQQPLLSQQPQQQQGQQQVQRYGSGPRQLSRGDAHPPCPYLIQTGTRSGLRCDHCAQPVASVGVCVGASPGATLADTSLSFTLDSGASHYFFRDHTTLTPHPAPISVALADPTSGPIIARHSATLPCPAVPSGSLTGLQIPSFSRNLVGVLPLMKRQLQQQQQLLLPPTLVTAPRQVPASHQVAVFGQVKAAGQVAASCSCWSLAHPTVLWYHRLGHPTLPRLRTMSSQHLVLGLPRVLPSLPPSPAPTCGPCVEGRLRATPHSSSLRPTTEPFKTLHLDVWGPASRPGPERESFFLVVVDDYSRYTTIFPLAIKSDVTSTLIRWLLATKGTRHHRVSCLHSDRGGEFFFDVLAGFCREQGILQSWTLPESPHQNGVAERRIGLVMEIARASMIHARAPHFLWPYVVQYATHLLNLWPRVSRPGVPSSSAQSSSQSPRQPLALPPQVAADLEGAGVRSADLGGASSGGVRVGAESVPARGPGAGGAGVGAEPVHPLQNLESLGLAALLLVVLALGVVRLVLWRAVLGLPPPRTLFLPPTLTRPGTRPFFAVHVRSSWSWSKRGKRWSSSSWSYSSWRSSSNSNSSKSSSRRSRSSSSSRSSSRRSRSSSSSRSSSNNSRSRSSRSSSSSSSSSNGRLRLLSLAFGPLVSPSLLLPLPPLLLASHSPCAHPSSPFPVTDLRTVLFRSSSPRPSPSLLPSPSESALTASLSTPFTDYYRTYCRVLSRLLASLVTDPRASLSSVSALTATVTEFAATRHLDNDTRVMASFPTIPLAVGGESTLGCDALEDRQFELEFLAAASPHLSAMLLAPEGDPDALDIPTPRTYAEAMSGPWASQWRAAMDAEMASYISTGTYVDEFPPLWANVVDGMWIFKVLQRFGFQFSTTQPTPLAVDHRLTGPFPDESFEPSGPYPELVGCLIHRPVHWTATVRVAKYLATTSGVGLVLGGRQPAVLTGHCDSSYADDVETHRSTQGYCFSLGSGAVSWRSTRSSSVSTSTAEAEVYAGAMAAQELRWLTFLLTDLGERPSSAPTLFTDNKAMILQCREPRLESRMKRISLKYFLLRELQRRGHARLDFVGSEANTADIFTKTLSPFDHQRFCVQLGLVDTGSRLV
ncbi:unnamed protein product [Closterium sp. NIES-53]